MSKADWAFRKDTARLHFHGITVGSGDTGLNNVSADTEVLAPGHLCANGPTFGGSETAGPQSSLATSRPPCSSA